ncbi:MAG: hypothetical protein AB1665_08495, partial [Candidatus Thermoplasmatota archaeon]
MKVAATCVLCAVLVAMAILPGRAMASPTPSSGTMSVVLDPQNELLTITIVSDTPWDAAMNFLITPQKILIVQAEGAAEYQGAAEVKIKEKPHKEVYKVIPKSDIEGDGVIVKFMCERTGLPAT